MITTKLHGLFCLFLLSLSCRLEADTVHLNQSGHETRELSESLTDCVRENLIHIFDSSNFHLMKGSVLPTKSQSQIQEQLKKVKSGSYIELDLDEPARIVVEGTVLKAMRMWTSIRESDGFVYDWILQQPNGDFVSLAKPRGELILQFAPHILHLLNQKANKIR
ncbi:MAG: hypothetical protein ACSHX0_10140 [Akkermansiaceae bacterium]